MADVARPDQLDEVVILERRRQVAQLYLAHQSQPAIARQLGVHQKTIWDDLQALRKEWREEARFDIAQIMERDIVELDEMEALAVRQWVETKDGHWFDRRLKVKERRARMLRFDAVDASGASVGEGSVADEYEHARRQFTEVLMALAAGGEAAASLEARLTGDGEVIEGRLADPGEAEPAPAAG